MIAVDGDDRQFVGFRGSIVIRVLFPARKGCDRGLRAGNAISAVQHEERHPVHADPARLGEIHVDLARVLRALQYFTRLVLGDADLGAEPDQRVEIVDDLAITEMRLEQPLVHPIAEPVLVGEMVEAVGVECVDRHGVVEVVRKTLRGGEFGGWR